MSDLYNPTDDHQALREALRSWATDHVGPQAHEYDEREEFNAELFRRLGREMGLFGVTVPAKDGGAGLDAVASVIIHEELSRFDPALTLSYLAHEVLFVNNFYHNASPDQCTRYLGKVLSGEWIAAMAMSEPDAGTDVLGMRTRAERRGDVYVLNGTKQWITNGPYADVFLIYAHTGRSDDDPRRSLSAFVVEASTPGFSVGKKEIKLGMRASPTSQLVFEEVEVPAENLLGEEGQALVHMMRNLEIERVALAAQSIGIALRCVDEMSRYAITERKAFGEHLVKFGQIQRMLAESYASTHAARALVYEVASRTTPDTRNSLGAAAAKLMATTTAETVARNAIQVFGGYGYTREYPVERMLRDAILLSIGGGTNEAMQKNIAADLTRMYR
ncbi:MAG: acyl-CoA dehydrogenase family protein [Myxococcota bacterium]